MVEDARIGRQLGRPVPRTRRAPASKRPPQGDHECRRHVEVAGGPGVLPHRAEVADLGEQAGGGRLARRRSRSPPRSSRRACTAHRSRRSVAASSSLRGGQPVEAVGAQRVEHAVAGPVVERGDEHRGVDEVGDRGGRVQRRARPRGRPPPRSPGRTRRGIPPAHGRGAAPRRGEGRRTIRWRRAACRDA